MSSPRSAATDRPGHRWRDFWGLVTLAGLALAFRVWSPTTVVVGLVLDTLCVAGVTLLIVACLGASGRRPDGLGRRVVVRSLAGVCALVTYAAVSSTTSALVAPLVLLAAVLTSPPVLHQIGRTSPRRVKHHDPDLPGTHRRPGNGSLFHA